MAPKAKSFANKGKAPASASVAKRKRDGDDDKAGKKRNREVLKFFEDEAEFDDDEELSDDSLFDDIDDFAIEEDVDIEVKVKKNSMKPLNASFLPKEEEMDEEEFDRMMEERYKSHPGFKYVGDDEARSLNDRGSLLSSRNPPIWKVKCMVGREKHLTFCLMQKFVDLKSLGNKLQIVSVFAVEHVKGFVFIEAEKECNLVEACRGLAGIYYTRVAPVKMSDLPLLLSARNKTNNIAEGMWVRVKSGNYKGDLGQVVAVNNSRRKVTVKLIPRIDLQALTAKYGGGIALRKKTAVPAPRLISSSELEEFRPLVQYRRDRDTGKTFEILDGMMLKDGFLYKKVSLDSLSYWGIMPSEEELLKFKSSENKNSDDLEWLTQLYGGSRKKQTLGNGKGLEKGESSSGLEKSKSSSGLEKGVSPSGLEKGESSGSGIRNKFELFELVCFGRKDYGLIVGMEKDGSFKILKDGPNAPMVTFLKERELKNGPSDMRFTASDQQGKTISANDTVKVLEGSLKDRKGIIKHIYRGTVFIYDDNEVENGGYICCKAQFCEKMKLAFDPSCKKGVESDALSFEGSPSSPKSPLPPQTQWQSKDQNHEFKEGGKDEIFSIGQTLRIRVGPLKGHLCRVLAIRYSDVTVKLDSKHKVLLVKSEHLGEVRGKNSTFPVSEDLGSSPFKAFDPLGAEGNSGDWAGGAGTLRDGDEWHNGGVSAERSSWPAFAGPSSVLCSESGLANPSGTVDDGPKTDSESVWNNVVASQNSSWGALATDDKAVANGVEDGSWGQKGDGCKTAMSDPCSSWDVPAASGGNQVGGWDKNDDPWKKTAEEDGSKKISSWGVSSTDNNAASDGNQVHSWGKRGEGWNKTAREITSSQTSSWGAPVMNTTSNEVPSVSCSSWDVPAGGHDHQVGGWGKKSDDGWKNAAQNDGSEKISSWGAPCADNNVATDGSQVHSWGKSGEGWNTAVKEVASNQTSSWGVPAAKNVDQGGKTYMDNHEQGSAWGKLDGESSVGKVSATSSWGKQGGELSWSNKGEESTWNKRWEESSFAKQGGESTWSKQEGGSSWNKQGQESESSWSKQQEGGSFQNKLDKENVGWKGGESSWSKEEGGSSWNKQSGKENVGWNALNAESSGAKPGEESTWSKQEGGSSWNKQGGESSWGKQVGESTCSKKDGGSTWNHQSGKENVGWNKLGGESSWGKQGGESSWSKQEGGSSWNQQSIDKVGGWKSSSDGIGGSFGSGREGGRGEGGWRGRGRGEGGWRGRGRGEGGEGRGEGGWRGSGGGRGEGGWMGRGGGDRGEGGWRPGGCGSWSGEEGSGNSGGQGSWAEKQENSSWGKQGGDSSWGKRSGDSSWGKQDGEGTGISGSCAEKQEKSSFGNQGSDSSWGKHIGDSSWGKQGGEGSGKSGGQGSWAEKQEKSSWGNQGGDSSWGKHSGGSSWDKQGSVVGTGNSGGQGSWAEKQEKSSWGKQGGDSSWGKHSGGSSWGKQGSGDGGNSGGQGSWTEKQEKSSWGNQDGDSSWGKRGGPGGGSSRGKQGSGEGTGNSGGQGSCAEKQEKSSWGKQGGDSSWGKLSGDSSWGKLGGDSGGSNGQSSWGEKQENSSWGKQGGDSPWGKIHTDLTLGIEGDNSGGSSARGSWEEKRENSGVHSSWGKGSGDSSWGKLGGDSGGSNAKGSWAEKQENLSWGKQEKLNKDVESSWVKPKEDSLGQQGGDSSWGKEAAGDSSWGKQRGDTSISTLASDSPCKQVKDSSSSKQEGWSSWNKADTEKEPDGGWKTGDGVGNSDSSGRKCGEVKSGAESTVGNSTWNKEPVGQDTLGGWSVENNRKSAQEAVHDGSHTSAKWGGPDSSSRGKMGWNSSTTNERGDPSTDSWSNADASGSLRSADPWNKPKENDNGSGGWN